MTDNSFISQVLNDLNQNNLDVTRLTYVVPSRRVATFLTKALATMISKPIFLPAIYSVEEFIAELSGMEIVPDLDLMPLFYESYLEVQPQDEQVTYDDFLGWAPTIIKDFNELDRYLVAPDDFFNYLGNVKELEDWHWSLGGEPTTMISSYLKFWKRLGGYYSRFRESCLTKGTLYQGLAYRMAYENLSNSSQLPRELNTVFNEYPIVFFGLNALNTAESEIIQQLLKDQKALIYWDTDDYFLNRPYHDAGKFISSFKKNWKYYKNNPLNMVSNQFEVPKKIEIAGINGTIGMVQVAARKLAELPPEEIENTIVVLADENLLLPLLTSLPDNIPAYNVTMGVSLDKLPIAAFVLDFIKLIVEKNEAGFYFKSFIRFLESPYTHSLIEKDKKNYKAQIRKGNLVYVTPEDLELNEGNALFNVLKTKNDIPSILETLENMILELKELYFKEGNRSLELEQLQGLREVLGGVENLLQSGHKIEDVRILSFVFRQLLPLKKLDFIGEPVKGLQIMGLLETRALDYKNQIMLSVNEGTLPAGKSTASYIPFDMKKRFGLPTYSDKDSVYAYHFYRLLHRSENATFIYNTETGGLGSSEKSRFLTQLITGQDTAHEIKEVNYIYKNEAITSELITLNKTPAYFTRLEDIAQKGFSPSALTSYVRNPLDFYRQKILSINEVEEVEENMALNTMGSIIHEALDKLYAQHLNKPLRENDFKEMRQRKKAELDLAYKKIYPSKGKLTGRNRIIYEVSDSFLSKMITMDHDLVKEGRELIILSTERHLSTQIEVSQIGVVKLHGTVDRIDKLDGVLRIIDYKSGKVEKGNLGLDPGGYDLLLEDYGKSKAFQILMYSYLYLTNEPDQDEVTAGMISFKNFQSGFLSFSLKHKNRYHDEPVTRDILEKFQEQLQNLLIELFDPEKPLEEKEV
ncbi:hypothetical protein BST97_10390 [Nonlabens spongiae]|uniref:PD-(D/E)XK endonuclease-like domain-containing protein n=1 Tax=Nonlabens spongiae TaxID=331648 RepID=A0A1W6MLB3_9FLAO|nr:PD-(D/E)XK nuclease family protein [Nonlabens spongiae]ARN78362.1 hypothetical protein BST97_10390 [Nonlabens spongiae]